MTIRRRRVTAASRRTVQRLEGELIELGTVVADRPPVVPTSGPGVVELLEGALVRARAGEVLAVGLAMVRHGGVTATEFVHGAESRVALHFAAAGLAHRVLTYDDLRPSEDP